MPDKKKARILHVLKSSIYSGAENVVINLIHQLQEQYDVAYVATDGAIREVLEREGIQHFLLKEYSKKGLARIVEEFQPDLIHAHDFTASIYSASVCKKAKVISHLHYDPPWSASWNLKTLVYTYYARRFSKILTVSERSFQHMVFSKLLQKKMVLVGNPINTMKIRTLGENDQNIPKCDLLFVGRLVEQKNPQRFIRIVKHLKEKGCSIKAIMLGDGELRETCEALIQDLGVQSEITLLGFQKNPYPYMKRAKLLCMTSDWEGYGLVILEANIFGIPALVFRTSGTEEVLGGNAEELCDSEEVCCEKIVKLLSKNLEYERWKKRAIERADQIVEPEIYAKKIETLYQTLV